VISTLYILVEMVLMTLPCHLYIAANTMKGPLAFGNFARLGGWMRIWLVGGTVACLILGVVATTVPLRIGMRAFRRLEF
jgi:ABC-2 type transport system permease protein